MTEKYKKNVISQYAVQTLVDQQTFCSKLDKAHEFEHLTHSPEWSLLEKEFELLRSENLKKLFLEDTRRKEDYCIQAAGIELDYSLQPINKEALFLLTELALRRHLITRINDLFLGERVNLSEQKSALHTALRAHEDDVILVDGVNVNISIQQTLERMRLIANDIRTHKWLGFQNSPITDVVHIGIGGSDLGPKMAVYALKKYHRDGIQCHFISDSDPDGFEDVISHLSPAHTLFIVVSKSFTTSETLLNLKKAMEWLGSSNAVSKHFIAITSQIDNAKRLGIQHILPIWDWVGGRYSFFSAVNLILMISIGPDFFNQLLAGGRSMDQHFRMTSFACNMPVLLALLGIWNLNFFSANNHLLLVYSKRLEYFLPYLQQLDMESNGKSISQVGKMMSCSTGPIVWGGLGNHAEHAFYQLLYQGSHYIPGDYIFIGEDRYDVMNQAAYKKLSVLAFGEDKYKAGVNKIILTALTPETLGALVALYEHKIYSQSVMWGINAFDQPGIDAAKQMSTICSELCNSSL